MNENEKEEEGNTQIVLPIICPNCKYEVHLGVDFSLLPPTEHEQQEEE